MTWLDLVCISGYACILVGLAILTSARESDDRVTMTWHR